METFLKHTYATEVDTDTNNVRGSTFDASVFNKIKELENEGLKFGKNSKDVIEFSAFTSENQLVGWKLLEQNPKYINRNVSFTDIDGNIQTRDVSYLDSLYTTTSDGNIIISPKYELNELGINQGEYKIRIGYRNDIVGSFENPYKLEIVEISDSRTEIKAVTQSFKDSKKPNQVAFNFEYNNFITKQVVVAHILTQIQNMFHEKTFVSELDTKEFSSKTSDYELYVKKISDTFSLKEYDILVELDNIFKNIKKAYNNLLLYYYNDVFTKERFLFEYINTIDTTLNNIPEFYQNKNEDIKIFYKYMLVQMLDQEKLDKVFFNRYEKYLANGMNFGNGLYVPFLKYKSIKDNSLSENSNDVLYIKTLTPLDEKITTGVSFYISQNLYSDDIVKSLILRAGIEKESLTYKLRGPDLSYKVTNQTTKEYSLKGEGSNLLESDLSSAEDYFRTTDNEINNLNIDYSDFSNFVKFSSARLRIDNFVLKMTNISKAKNKINQANVKINDTNVMLNNGELSQEDATRIINLITENDLKKLNKKILDIKATFTPYEKFLYYDDSENAWPRETSFKLSGFTKNVLSANGEYKLKNSKKYDLNKVFVNVDSRGWVIEWDAVVSRWKLTNNNLNFFLYSKSENLNNGFLAENKTKKQNNVDVIDEDSPINHFGFNFQESSFSRLNEIDIYKDNDPVLPPETIPSDLADFKNTDGYAWYKSKAGEAEQYDRFNDDSLKNSIPEFLVRSNENDDFTKFLYMIGEQFDILLVYIESMSDMAKVRNSFTKGIPNQLVWFVMNSFGVKFTGRVVDELSISKQFEKNRDTVWRRILNNLPYILKSSGTEESVRSLFRCYGIPEQLFTIREFGGVDYDSEQSENPNFKVMTSDYALKFNSEQEYLEIPIGDNSHEKDDISYELRISVDSKFIEKIQKNKKEDNLLNYGKLPSNYGEKKSIQSLYDSDFNNLIDKSICGIPTFYTKGKNEESFIPDNWKDLNNINPIALSWKNVREGISFSYPKVESGTNPVFMTIYSDSARDYTKSTKLTQAVNKDSNIIYINESDKKRFKTGDRLVIDEGMSTEEYVEIKDIDTFTLKNNLKFNHIQNSIICDNSYDPIHTLAEIGATEELNGKTVYLNFNDLPDSKSKFSFSFIFNGTLSGSHYTIKELERIQAEMDSFQPIIKSNELWEFGIHSDASMQSNYGKFYLNFLNLDGTLLCPNEKSKPIYFDIEKEYDILITKSKKSTKSDSVISLKIKRVYDGSDIFSDENSIIVTEQTSKSFSETSKIYFGNYESQNEFRGTLDRLRVYSDKIDDKTFSDHINHNQGYSIGDYNELESKLLVKVNFDHPYKLDPVDIKSRTGKSTLKTDTIINYALSEGARDITPHGFISNNYPYNFVGKTRNELTNLPRFGARVFNNNKIRIESFDKVTELSPVFPSTKKSNDRTTNDSNTLGIYFSPTDIINEEVVRFLGSYNIGDLLGDPRDANKSRYTKFESLRKTFFKYGFGKIDIQKYFNLIKSYIDPSLFENLEKIIPARADLLTGLLIEPSILERPKIIPPRIKSIAHIDSDNKKVKDKKSVTNLFNIKINLSQKNKNIISFANERRNLKTANNDFKISLNSKIKSFKNNSEFTFPRNFSGQTIGCDVTDIQQDVFSINGLYQHNNKLYKVESSRIEKKIGTNLTSKKVDYSNYLNEGIEILGFRDGMQTANGKYSFSFTSNNGLPVFTDSLRIWWVFYSSDKDCWILASDATKNGGKYLANGNNQNYENYTWIQGNSITEGSTKLPEWFSTGIGNSLESDNLPKKNKDYYASVDFISEYNRYIECNAYLNGWVDAELIGTYHGEYVQKIEGKQKTYRKDEYKFIGDRKKVYLNGNFKGKIQNGWIGSENKNESDSEKVIRIIGLFDGTEYESCDNPFYVSGNVNDIVSFDRRDKLILDYSRYDSDIVRYTKKKFDSINLIKIPNKITHTNFIDYSFNKTFLIENKEITSLKNYSSGKCITTHTYRTIDKFYSPPLHSIEANFKTILKTNCPVDLFVLAKNINLFSKKINNVMLNKNIFNFNLSASDTSYAEIVKHAGSLKPDVIYNVKGEVLPITLTDLINELNTNINFKFEENSVERLQNLIKDEINFCVFLYGESLQNFEFAFITTLQKTTNKEIKLKNSNFGYNTRMISKNSKTIVNESPMHTDSNHEFIREIKILNGGGGYVGSESVEIFGTMPKNWKSTWPVKTDVSSLFKLNYTTGKIIGVNNNHFLISGNNWLLDSTIKYTEVPSIKIDNPIGFSDVKLKKADLRIISGEPTPFVETNVNLINYTDLSIGDTIGKPLSIANMHFIGKSVVKYDTGLVHNKNIKIKTDLQKNNYKIDTTQCVIITNESLVDFGVNLDKKLNKILKSDMCGNYSPVISDTYSIQIVPISSDDNLKFTYKSRSTNQNNFFLIFNNLELKDHATMLTNEKYVDKLAKYSENLVSTGYVQITSFYGKVSSANGIYRYRNDILYCDTNDVITPIPTYTNENLEWIITYDDVTQNWKLSSLKNTDYIISIDDNIENGFLANADNNSGFISGEEILLNDNYRADSNGFVYDIHDKIVGKRFQSGSVSVSNKFHIKPNVSFFEEHKNKINNCLIWKIKIKSNLNSNYIYEIPVIYINSDKNEQNYIEKYKEAESILEQQEIIQYQDSTECLANKDNIINWKIRDNADISGVFSEQVKIKTQGLTSLNVNCFSHDKTEGVTGDYYKLITNKITNENNYSFVYSNSDQNWEIKSSDNLIIYKKDRRYPTVGIYKTTTKNIYGISEYRLDENSHEVNIFVRNFNEEYEPANGIYKSVGMLDTGEYMFRNEDSNWIFYTDNGGDSWTIQDARRFPRYTILYDSNIPQVGIYTNNKQNFLSKVFVNFDIKFIYDDLRQFLNLDRTNYELKSDNGANYVVYDSDGYEKKITNDLKLDVKLNIICTKKQTNYRHFIPCEARKNSIDLYNHLGLQVDSSVKLENEGVVTLGTEIGKILNINKTNISYSVPINNTELKNYTLYNNEFSSNFDYTKDDIVYYNYVMYRCKRDTPKNRSVIPGYDFDWELFWEISTSTDIYTNLSISVDVKCNTSYYQNLTIKKDHDFNFVNVFSENFVSRNQLSNGVVNEFNLSTFEKYQIEKKYQPFDLANVGGSGEAINGKTKTHTYNTYSRNLHYSVNDVNTTVNKSGFLSETPVIVRTPKLRESSKDGIKDSFWFNLDRKNKPTYETKVTYEKPHIDPIINFRFEDYDSVSTFSLEITGFESASSANGLYEMTHMEYKNYPVFSNNDYLFYFATDCWVLSSSTKLLELSDLINTDHNYTTSKGDKLGSSLNGNFGSSELFFRNNANVYIKEVDIIEKTPTPSANLNDTTPTPSPSPENKTPVSLPTPTPSIQFNTTPTPTLNISTGISTPTPIASTSDDIFVFEYEDYAITNKKYDLSSNTNDVLKEIKDDLLKNNIEISGLASVEDVLNNVEILDKIDEGIIKNFAIKVESVNKLGESTSERHYYTNYTWDSSGQYENGEVLAFYLSKNKQGKLHLYNNRTAISNGYYLKSWLGSRYVMVKLKNQVDPVTNIVATKSRVDGVLLTWRPSFNADYIRLEILENGRWVVLNNNVSQVFHSLGYLDETISENSERTYRFISVGISGRETISATVIGWKLAIPTGPSYLNCSYEKHPNKITLNWDKSPENKFTTVDGYSILRSEQNNFDDYSSYIQIASNIKETNYVDEFKIPGTSTDGKYWYVVIANNNRSKNLTKDEYKQRINWSPVGMGKV